MAAAYIPVGNTVQGQNFVQALRNMLVGLEQLKHVRASMIQCIDGSDYSVLETVFGFPTGKGAAAFAEIDSFYAKISVDTQVTNVKAAWEQVNAKFGIP